MKAFILVDVNIKDMEGFMSYAKQIEELIKQYQGFYLVKGATPDVLLDNTPAPEFSVVIEFPSMQHADDFIVQREKDGLKTLFENSVNGRILKVLGCV